MTEVTSGELQKDLVDVLRRVEDGKDVTITVDGRPVAALHVPASRPTFVSREAFVARVASCPADAGLAADLQELVQGSTDDLGR